MNRAKGKRECKQCDWTGLVKCKFCDGGYIGKEKCLKCEGFAVVECKSCKGSHFLVLN